MGVATMSTKENNLLTQRVRSQSIEKRCVEVFATPHPPTRTVLFIEPMHALHQRRVEVLTRKGSNLKACFTDCLSLSLDVAALISIKFC